MLGMSLEGRVLAGSQHQRNVDCTSLCRVECLVRGKGPVNLQKRTQMSGVGIRFRVVAHIGIAEGVRGKQIAELDCLAAAQ